MLIVSMRCSEFTPRQLCEIQLKLLAACYFHIGILIIFIFMEFIHDKMNKIDLQKQGLGEKLAKPWTKRPWDTDVMQQMISVLRLKFEKKGLLSF